MSKWIRIIASEFIFLDADAQLNFIQSQRVEVVDPHFKPSRLDEEIHLLLSDEGSIFELFG
jgi:hypothetical protein